MERGGGEEVEEGWGERDEEQVIFSRDDVSENSITYQASSPDDVMHCFNYAILLSPFLPLCLPNSSFRALVPD